jgi:hypothetical protein
MEKRLTVLDPLKGKSINIKNKRREMKGEGHATLD